MVPQTSVLAGQNVVGPCWANIIETDDLFKSLVVVQGWAQVPGIYYGGTFVPVRRLQSIRMMLAIVAEHGYEVLMLGVQTTFLNAGIKKEVYVKIPPGYETYDKSGTPFVMKLKKSLYGLRQIPKNWFGTMGYHLSNIILYLLKSDPCVCAFEGITGFSILTLCRWHSST